MVRRKGVCQCSEGSETIQYCQHAADTWKVWQNQQSLFEKVEKAVDLEFPRLMRRPKKRLQPEQEAGAQDKLDAIFFIPESHVGTV